MYLRNAIVNVTNVNTEIKANNSMNAFEG